MAESQSEKAIDKIVKNLVAQTIFDIIPFAGPIFKNTYDAIRAKRLRTFRDELRHSGILDEHMNDDDLVHAAYCTIEATLRTREDEKIRMYARILQYAYDDEAFRKHNHTEEVVKIIMELSIEEILLLRMLEKVERKFSTTPMLNPRENARNKMQELSFLFGEQYGSMTRQAMMAKFIRLNRTGCIQLHPGSDGGYGLISLTPIYAGIRVFLMERPSSEQ